MPQYDMIFDYDTCLLESNIFYCLRELWGYKVAVPISNTIVYDYVNGGNRNFYVDRYPNGNNVRSVGDSNFIAESSFFMHIILAAIGLSILSIIDKKIGKLIATGYFGIKDETDLKRFIECFWQFSYYFPITIFGFCVLLTKSWFWNTAECWEPPFPTQPVELDTYIFYTTQIGWYLHCTVFTLYFDRKIKDFYVMLTHHVATLCLLYPSFATGHYRVGVIILCSLDICDIFLHWIKMLRFVDNAHHVSDFIKTGTYVALVLAWIIFRVGFFFFKALYVASVEAVTVGGWQNADYWGYYNTLLFVIAILQIYWLYCILLIGYKYVRFGDELDDVRDLSNANDIAKKRNLSRKKKN
eukprot:TRINITY_DN802_c1_g1_i1.p1 TRINITY_DN802_c1_g1~~TRINITY_DN802_c1_g1_i1.p1  ORF type:complete len:355 (-),score=77.68 TRINITY_DN802_c1_g1_i1:103-1167(-)